MLVPPFRRSRQVQSILQSKGTVVTTCTVTTETLCYCLSSVSIASNLAVSERILNDAVYEVDMAIPTPSCRFC